MKKFLVSIFIFYLLFSTSLAIEGTNRIVKVNKLIDDEISETGEVDCFNFSISDPGSIQIRFEFDVEGSYTVKLINTDIEREIQTTSFSSNVNTSSGRYEKMANKIRVGKGDYQVQVSCGYFSSCDKEYELEIIYEEEDSDRYEKEPNNDAKNAMLIEYNRDVIGNLESTDDVDYYMIEVPSNGELYVELEFEQEASYNVAIYSDDNGRLNSLYNKKFEAKLNKNSSKYTDTSDVLRVPRGYYYFKISKTWSDYSNDDYTLCAKFLKNNYGNYEIEYNDEPRNATDITVNNEFIGNLNSNIDIDYYRVNIWDANKLMVKMNIPEDASYNVTTYKEVNGELSQIKSERFSNKDLVGVVSGSEQEISNGEYYFKVTSSDYSNKDYTFLVETNNNYYNSSEIYNKTTIVLEIGNPYMLVNNATYPIDGNRGTAPTILNSRTMLPARAIIESLGGNVTWIESGKGININLDGKNIYLTLDSALAYVNGEQRWLDVAPTSINGRTMIPVKFVMDNLGGSVIWNATTGTVTITY